MGRAGTGQSTRNFTFDGDGFGAMSGTSKEKSEMFEMRPWMFLRDGLAALGIPVVLNVFDRNGENVARICRFGRTRCGIR